MAYDTDEALEFVSKAAESPGMPLRTIHERVTQSGSNSAYLQVPSVAVTMSDAEKAAVMGYCADQRVPLSELVASELQQFAAELCADE